MLIQTNKQLLNIKQVWKEHHYFPLAISLNIRLYEKKPSTQKKSVFAKKNLKPKKKDEKHKKKNDSKKSEKLKKRNAYASKKKND